MKKTCPYCGADVRESGHVGYGLQKLERGVIEAGVPVVGRLRFRRETLVMVFVCERANLPFLVVLPDAK